ncbi:methyltransferase domain-containing protein [Spirillospora sp. CA-255316]
MILDAAAATAAAVTGVPAPLLPLAVGAGVLVNAVRLRRRIICLSRVSPAVRDAPLCWAADGREAEGPYGPYELLTAEKAVLSGQARRAALAHARAHDLQVLDLIPSDLPVERALDLARGFDPRKYRVDPLAVGCGAGFATVVAADVLGRARLNPGPLEPGEYGAATARLRQFAQPRRWGKDFAADLAVVSAHTTPRAPACAARKAWLRGLGVSMWGALGGSALGYALVWLALAADVTWGMPAVAAYCLVPYVVFAKTPLRPRDLHRSALLRLVQTPWNWWQTLRAPETVWERVQAAREAEAREHYRDDLTEGLERFFEPPRDVCPWCGGWSLEEHVTSRDVVQAKPGRFTLDRCAECGHIFQNPRLNQAGLEFYYRDAYDGLGAAASERLFAMQGAAYQARAELAALHLGPRTWLDVGAGHGHFCRTARKVLPETEFDGLDLGAGVEEGARRGWLRRAYRGRFPDLVDDLAGRYDIVSMHHYLEHTTDPPGELDAAVKILAPGGHLLIELPDPECRTARLLGRRWGSWLQPQHLHMISIGNLERALAARGMHVVARERRGARQPHDLAFSVLTALTALAPDPSRPWAPPGGGHRLTRLAKRALRVAGLLCAGPLLILAVLLDRLLLPLIPGTSNAYRLLARKDEG